MLRLGFCALTFAVLVPCTGAASPVEKVVQMLTNLEAKITEEGKEAEITFAEFSTWCEERSSNIAYDIETNTANVEGLQASIEEASSTITSLGAKIDDLGATISTDEADLKAATGIREQEGSDFAAEEKELKDVVSALQRAIGVLEREAQTGGAAMLQMQKAKSVAEMLRIMVDASMLQSQDASTLTALVQSSQQSDAGVAVEGSSDDSELDAYSSSGSANAPEAAAYENQSGNVIDVLKDLLDKARDQLGEAQKKEMNSKHNFEMLKQSLVDEIRFSTKDMNVAKQASAAQREEKAKAEGDLAVTSKTLAEDKKTAKTLNHDCMSGSQDYEAAVKSRGEELKALAAAKKALVEKTGGAADLAYGASSLLQVRSDKDLLKTGADLANFEVVHFLRNLARQQNSDALAQLARNVGSAMHMATGAGGDPFAKVKGLIQDMLHRLQKEASADATHKAYCDKEMGETMAKKGDKDATIDKLSTKIAAMSASSAQLKEQVALLQKALAELASSQAEATALRHKEKAQFEANSADTKNGLEGVKVALQVLREYYSKEGFAHGAKEGESTGIIALLEVVQSDFSMGLAEMEAAENSAASQYQKESNENEISKTTKQQDVRYKTKEARELDTAVTEATNDRTGVQAELTAILQYKEELVKMCVAKPETYEERKSRREAELAGLKEALKILAGEAALLQRGSASALRGRGRILEHSA